MKHLFTFLLAILLCIPVWAQDDEGKEEKSSSKTLEFMSTDGTFLLKEYIDLGKVKGVKCEVAIITDVVSGKKMGCMRLETKEVGSYSTYIGTLDYDELDACVQSINYIIETILPSTPENYTELEYKTRDGVKVGAFYRENTNLRKKQWSAYIYTKGYTSRSAAFFDSENLAELRDKMLKAKEIISQMVDII